ncbi:MAG: hypothetical protein EB121_07555, partial [Alphaproteobacteria bacterium]|nr:hypothetical protein [Alphaproteobacteria bacterium]
PQKFVAAPVKPAAHVASNIPEAEISEEEAAGVADMFSSAPPAAKPAAASTGKLNAADILARAKSRLAGK